MARKAHRFLRAGERAQLRQEIIAAELRRGWSLRVAMALAKRWGVTDRTIRNHRARLLRDLAKDMQEITPEMARAALLQQVEEVLMDAREDREHGPALRALYLKGRISGLLDPEGPVAPAIQITVVAPDVLVSDLQGALPLLQPHLPMTVIEDG